LLLVNKLDSRCYALIVRANAANEFLSSIIQLERGLKSYFTGKVFSISGHYKESTECEVGIEIVREEINRDVADSLHVPLNGYSSKQKQSLLWLASSSASFTSSTSLILYFYFYCSTSTSTSMKLHHSVRICLQYRCLFEGN
ncbi:hypothetical protein Tco_0418741, partial [Tanacetum coccineum]